MPRSRPLVIAHRGSSVAAPEHTRAAYEQAVRDGADAIECDVRLARDDVVVCFHDATLRRVGGRTGRVGRMTGAELAAVDVGVTWRRTAAGELAVDVTRVVAFEELLGIVAAAGRPVGLRIEVKRPARGGDLVERLVVAALAEHGLLPRAEGDWSIAAMSLSAKSLQHFHRLAPSLPLVRLLGLLPSDTRLAALPRWIGAVGPDLACVRADPTLPDRIHATDRLVNVWTVNRPEDVDLMVRTGVDGIITDRPRDVLNQLQRAAG